MNAPMPSCRAPGRGPLRCCCSGSSARVTSYVLMPPANSRPDPTSRAGRHRHRAGCPVRPQLSTATTRVHAAYRSTGADLLFGDPLPAHGVAMEGYFWRFTDPASGRVRHRAQRRQPRARRALVDPGRWPRIPNRLPAHRRPPEGLRLPGRAGRVRRRRVRGHRRAAAGRPRRRTRWSTSGSPSRSRWPRRCAGGSSVFQAVPALNQYWHPWLLGGAAHGRVVVGEDSWDLDGWQVYGGEELGQGRVPRLLVVGAGPGLRGPHGLRRVRRRRRHRRTAADPGHRPRRAAAGWSAGAARRPGGLAGAGRGHRRELGARGPQRPVADRRRGHRVAGHRARPAGARCRPSTATSPVPSSTSAPGCGSASGTGGPAGLGGRVAARRARARRDRAGPRRGAAPRRPPTPRTRRRPRRPGQGDERPVPRVG